jgi:hypothetical protein
MSVVLLGGGVNNVESLFYLSARSGLKEKISFAIQSGN